MDLATYIAGLAGGTGVTFLLAQAVLGALFGGDEAGRRRHGPLFAIVIGVVVAEAGVLALGGGRIGALEAFSSGVLVGGAAMGVHDAASSAGVPV